MRKYRKDIEENIISILRKIKNNDQMINKVKQLAIDNGMLSGEVIRLFVNHEKIRDIGIGSLYLFMIQLFKVSQDKTINPNILDLYNPETKARFLTKLGNKSQDIYLRIFEVSSEVEYKRKKDLYELNLDDIEIILYTLRPLTNDISHVNGRIVTSYLNWCIEKELISTNLLTEKNVDWFSQFVDKDIQLYYSESEIRKIEDNCANYQDNVIVRLLFEGVQGSAMSEIRNVQRKDVNHDTNEIKVRNERGDERIVNVSDRAMNMIQNAFAQIVYIKKNGHMLPDTHMSDKTNLVENDYLIRSSLTKTISFNKEVDKIVLYRRIQTIAETLGYEKSSLTAKNIVRSGMIYEGKKILDEKGSLEREDYLNICAKYNMNPNNWYPLKRFINEKVIGKLYKNNSR
ncbi:phage lytic cycle repressor MrpR family protein [Chengkuizengella marina]|uniref:Uncharacterized protein n=1 Tax=Chengkuizengella marina TaxID=2507566 RepID=A0A6N9PYR1_9BACL|nr:hypothetical protein [Chengkuizengella marina]NBI28659.1 hypothetical protein [Chengkuizengella marina]